MKEIVKQIMKKCLGGWLHAYESMLEVFRTSIIEYVRTANLLLHSEVEKLGELIKNESPYFIKLNSVLAIVR